MIATTNEEQARMMFKEFYKIDEGYVDSNHLIDWLSEEFSKQELLDCVQSIKDHAEMHQEYGLMELMGFERVNTTSNK